MYIADDPFLPPMTVDQVVGFRQQVENEFNVIIRTRGIVDTQALFAPELYLVVYALKDDGAEGMYIVADICEKKVKGDQAQQHRQIHRMIEKLGDELEFELGNLSTRPPLRK